MRLIKREDLLGPESTDGISSGRREFKLYTGFERARAIHHEFEKENAKDLMNWLIEKEVLTLEEKKEIIKMLESPDLESFNLAITLLNVKRDGIRI